MRTSELKGAALDWAVAKCAGDWAFEADGCDAYSTDWSQGGPIIERERIDVYYFLDGWGAEKSTGPMYSGSTPLIAAMRCYVASKLGDEVEIPKELT